MTAAAISSRDVARADVRERWRMSPEARALVLTAGGILVFGLAVLYSASAIQAVTEGRTGAYYLLRQLFGVAVGTIAFMIAAKMDAERWREWAWPLMWFTLAAMLLVLILPHTIAPRINGSKRFLFGTSLQPSEIGKFAVVVWTAMLVVKKGDRLRRFSRGLMPFLVVLLGLCLLAAAEPDLSVAMLYTVLMAIVLFAGGVRLGHFVLLGALAIPWLWVEIERVQYALLRLTSFLDPGQAPQVGYQLHQSLLAVGSGGWFGAGFGEGRQQYGFLPYPYSDFIASNVGEEWGFVAGLLPLTLAFAAYAMFGFRIARAARSPFLQLVAVGLTFTTVLTAYVHIGVVVGLLPTTGLTLPFVSYGRSNLVLTMFLTGVLVNIGSLRERVIGTSATNPFAASPPR
ncbi:MAG: putative peptidoglycan glycosyltransferase FtsW [Gemmatimonadaceae bacterium]